MCQTCWNHVSACVICTGGLAPACVGHGWNDDGLQTASCSCCCAYLQQSQLQLLNSNPFICCLCFVIVLFSKKYNFQTFCHDSLLARNHVWWVRLYVMHIHACLNQPRTYYRCMLHKWHSNIESLKTMPGCFVVVYGHGSFEWLVGSCLTGMGLWRSASKHHGTWCRHESRDTHEIPTTGTLCVVPLVHVPTW